jgi:hypothetical protein
MIPGSRLLVSLGVPLVVTLACAHPAAMPAPSPAASPVAQAAVPPTPDPRIGLRAGLMDAGEAAWNLKVLSQTPPPERFKDGVNSDLAFRGHDVIQGNFNGFQVWDVTDPARPVLQTAYYCPASQSDVSVYKNLLFVSGEGLGGRLDCGGEGVQDVVSKERLRGIRIFDITDITSPRYLANVQTCRGSHTHSLLVDPRDRDNVYVYVSGSAPVRPAEELPGCVSATPDEDPNSALFRIEVIKVPLAHPEQAAVVSSPHIFKNLTAPPTHGEAPQDVAAAAQAVAAARARGGYVAKIHGLDRAVSSRFTDMLLDSVVHARSGTGGPTAADSAALRGALQGIVDKMFGEEPGAGPKPGPTQCHDITLDPDLGLAGGACEGYGLLLDISDPANPVRIDQVADSNFSYWHSATFNNDGTKILFSDEWGGGGAPKCRATDPREWGADAIFTIENRRMVFRSYYKLPAPQTSVENCVAHNGSLIPIPGRDVMAQAWYQGGISVFDWTDAAHPVEIAFFDRGPVDSTKMELSGSWSVYWYDGVLVSSEITRGLDIFALEPSGLLTQNEIDAAKTVRLDYFNTQGQPKFVWPPSFALARAYVDQVERSRGLPTDRIAAIRQGLERAEQERGAARRDALDRLASQLDADARGAADAIRVRRVEGAVRELGAATR